jgi:hypothetical protein
MNLFKRKQHSFDYAVTRSCLNCSTVFSGRYCFQCGERVIVREEDRSLKHFLSDILNAFTFIDGKFFHSLITLVRYPGKMTDDIAIGIRQRYMKPIAFFFVANFIYFLFPFFETFKTTLNVQMNQTSYSALVKTTVESHLKTSGQSIEDLTLLYNAETTNWSKLLLIVSVVYLTPFVALINYRRDKYFLDHLHFSLEFMTFVIFIPTILFGFLLQLLYGFGKLFEVEVAFALTEYFIITVVVLLFLYFFVTGIRRFYKFPWWRVIVNSMLMVLACFVCVVLMYRFTLFWVTIKNL